MAEVEKFDFAEDERHCSELDAAKRNFGNAITEAKKSLDAWFLELQLPRKHAAHDVVKI